ncbi:MAG TPA: hypothetical protein PLG55_10050 [Methanospirillum sp.]|jgi:hypothetical protein|uniref:hypothetical protein n=1 Tax=Methanospirillum sp. TaxID=45200 RepID=UPI0009CD7269|nr:hypothetical protein [Methanospirillum sp.]OQB37470.1 MAG: hypothetical protein BWY05_00792 [Euryarchaeota archaeon ADurb.Bin165]HPY61049.1 hypothetical protein [Methanospirillum sp.]
MKKELITRLLPVLLSVLVLAFFPVLADESKSTNQTNTTPVNATPVNETPANITSADGETGNPGDVSASIDGAGYDISGLYADAGRLSTDFSGSSIEASGNNQSPSVVMSFSDRSSVSGFIKNFMKSFHYESGTEL